MAKVQVAGLTKRLRKISFHSASCMFEDFVVLKAIMASDPPENTH